MQENLVPSASNILLNFLKLHIGKILHGLGSFYDTEPVLGEKNMKESKIVSKSPK